MLLFEKDKLLDSLNKRNYLGRQMLDEIRNLYPQISNCSYAESYSFHDTTSNPDKIGIVVFTTKGKNLVNSEKEKIENWLKIRLKSKRINIYYERWKRCICYRQVQTRNTFQNSIMAGKTFIISLNSILRKKWVAIFC